MRPAEPARASNRARREDVLFRTFFWCGAALVVALVAAGVGVALIGVGEARALLAATTDPAVLAAAGRLERATAAAALLVVVGALLGVTAVTLLAALHVGRLHDRARREALERALVEVREARDAAERASSSKSKLIARVSHELRTPMNGVVGMTEVLLAQPLPPALRTRLQVLDHSAQAMRAILDELLQVSRGEAGFIDLRPEAFDLYELVTRRVSLHAATARGLGVELALDVTVDAPRRVLGDPVRVGQVLGNLIDNAVKYGGSAVVTVRLDTAPEGVVFAVVDRGPGVPPEARDRVFEAFARLPAAQRHGGTGLGLTLCRQIVQAMGGRIGVDETPGGGATFWFVVPLEPASEAERARRAPAPPVDLGAIRVLGVDDHAVNLQVLGAMLRTLGVAYETVSSGEAALELLREAPFDVVLMDVEMPGMDGREATRQLRREGIDVPVVAFTAHAMVDERHACAEAGMVDVLAKPVSLEDLRDTLQRWTAPERRPRPASARARVG